MLRSFSKRSFFQQISQNASSADYRVVGLAVSAAVVFTAMLSSQSVFAQDMSPKLRASLNMSQSVYRIAPGDTLSVNVYNQSDLTAGSILVRPDGYASFNGIGEVAVAGKTIREVTAMLEQNMKDLVRQPIVSLTVTESHAPTIGLAGAVMHPGVLQPGLFAVNSSAATSNDSSSSSSGGGSSSSGSTTMAKMDYRLSTVLSAAGGVQLSADLSNVQVVREGQPTQNVDLWKLIRNGDMSQDLMLQNGDTVFVPTLAENVLDDASYQMLLRSGIGPKTFPVRVLGYVQRPGIYDLNGTSPYLDTALVKASGFNVGANRKQIALRRFTGETKFSTIAIDPNKTDFMLRPNDVVYVAELRSYKAGHFMDNVSKILSPFTSVSSTILNYAILNKAYGNNN
jgi:protein involved in polysaccharide export with SLBB domain